MSAQTSTFLCLSVCSFRASLFCLVRANHVLSLHNYLFGDITSAVCNWSYGTIYTTKVSKYRKSESPCSPTPDQYRTGYELFQGWNEIERLIVNLSIQGSFSFWFLKAGATAWCFQDFSDRFPDCFMEVVLTFQGKLFTNFLTPLVSSLKTSSHPSDQGGIWSSISNEKLLPYPHFDKSQILLNFLHHMYMKAGMKIMWASIRVI